MISEERQDQAALYALDLLSPLEATAFERELAENPELQELVHELRDAAGALALSSKSVTPPAALKGKVMEQIAAEARTPAETSAPKIIPFPSWISWAIAAALALFCGLLALDRARLKERLAQEEVPAEQPILVSLAPSEQGPPQAAAIVAWEPGRQEGTIRINNLPAAGAGKDYQLWAVDAAHKDPISAGIVRIGPDGVAQVRFKPDLPAHHVKAFAISVEREGGGPKKEGPILLVGTT